VLASTGGPFEIRRNVAARRRRCEYDIEPMLHGRRNPPMIQRRTICLIFSRPLDAKRPKVFEVVPALFELISNLGSWTRQQPEHFRQDQRTLGFYRRLEGLGFIEARPCDLR
jgi:hypothetical protein